MTEHPTARPVASLENTRDGGAERRMELLVGRLLQAGVLCSAATVMVGGAALVARDGGHAADFHHFVGTAARYTSFRDILRGVALLDSRAIVQLGLLMLIATPIARVALTLVSFVARRDRLYAALSAIVLALLVLGLLGGPA